MTKKEMYYLVISTTVKLNAAQEIPLTALPMLPSISKLQALAFKAAVVPKNGQTEADATAIEQNKATINNKEISPGLLLSPALELYKSLPIAEFRKLPDKIKNSLPPISIQDLIEYGKIPAFQEDSNRDWLTRNWMTLDLSNYFISDLEGIQNIPGIKNLDSLYLKHNKITEITPNAFHGLDVNDIDLSHNRITDITPNAFNGLEISNLNLSHNKIVQIRDNAFNGLNLMYEGRLNLSHNKIIQIRENAFSGIPDTYRAYLSLSHNKITKISDNAFKGADGISFFDLSHNQITEINNKSFYGLYDLCELDLSHNQITQIVPNTFKDVYNLADVIDINLSHNQITQIGENAFNEVNYRYTLNLSHNQITQIAPNAFNGLHNLVKFDVSHNLLDKYNIQHPQKTECIHQPQRDRIKFLIQKSVDLQRQNNTQATLLENQAAQLAQLMQLVQSQTMQNAQLLQEMAAIRAQLAQQQAASSSSTTTSSSTMRDDEQRGTKRKANVEPDGHNNKK